MAYDFDTIARGYDRMNHLMSLGLDRWWRRRVAQEVVSVQCPGGSVLDVACGTGDMVLELVKRGCTVTGIDLSEEMLAIAERKSRDTARRVRSRGNGLSRTRHAVSLQKADAEHLPFEDDSFDAVTCAFGVRNFVHLEQGLSEMLRVLKPGGLLFTANITAYASTLHFVSVYDKKRRPALDSDAVFSGLERTVKTGVHTGGGLGLGYFHKPEELKAEIEDAGFLDVDIRGVIGPCWLIRNLERAWKNEKKRENIMRVVRLLEKEESIMGLSTHFLSISRKQKDDSQKIND